jgi:hypothetical protein
MRFADSEIGEVVEQLAVLRGPRGSTEVKPVASAV